MEIPGWPSSVILREPPTMLDLLPNTGVDQRYLKMKDSSCLILEMNNDVLYEVIKYVDFPVEDERASSMQSSGMNFRRMMRLNRDILERKLSNRPTINYLKMKNIYREEDYRVDFNRIHSELSDLFYRRGAPPLHNIASRLAHTAKTMDFKLKRVILASKLQPHISKQPKQEDKADG